MLDSSFSGFPGDTKKEKEMTFDMLLCSQIVFLFFFSLISNKSTENTSFYVWCLFSVCNIFSSVIGFEIDVQI